MLVMQLRSIGVLLIWCLFAGGGIRDSGNSLMEKTSDAGGMCLFIL